MLVVFIIIIVLLTILAAQNTLPCAITFIGLKFNPPIVVPLLAFLLLGFLLGFIYSELDARRERRKLKEELRDQTGKANKAIMDYKFLEQQVEQEKKERERQAALATKP